MFPSSDGRVALYTECVRRLVRQQRAAYGRYKEHQRATPDPINPRYKRLTSDMLETLSVDRRREMAKHESIEDDHAIGKRGPRRRGETSVPASPYP